jgi:hypothetical protein
MISFDLAQHTKNIAGGRLPAIAAVLLFCLWVSQSALSQSADESSSKTCNSLLTAGPDGSDPCANNSSDSSQTETNENTPASSPQQDDAQARPVDFHYVPALNGGDPIVVPQPFHMQYFYGGATTQGFDSAVAGPFRNLPTFESVYDGYAATSMQWRKAYLLLQHDSTFTHYSASEIRGNLFHRTSLLASGDFNRSLSWDFEARNTLGNDALQLISPLPSRTVGRFAIAEPVSADLGINQGTIWGADAVAALTWHPDAERTFKIFTHDAYTRLFTDNTHNDIKTFRLEYEKSVSERTSYGFYAQTARQIGQILCNTNGAGVDFRTEPNATTILEVAAGPEFGSKGCGRQQAFNFHFAAAKALNATTRAYATANREFSSGYVSHGTWEDNVVVGVGKQLGRQIEVGCDAGYVKGQVVLQLTPYHGFFASCEARKRLSSSFTLVGSYRRFDHTVSNSAVRRNIAIVTLVWTPLGHDARRSSQYNNTESIVDTKNENEHEE